MSSLLWIVQFQLAIDVERTCASKRVIQRHHLAKLDKFLIAGYGLGWLLHAATRHYILAHELLFVVGFNSNAHF